MGPVSRGFRACAAYQYGVAMATLSAALRLMRIDHRQVQAILYAIAGADTGRRAVGSPL